VAKKDGLIQGVPVSHADVRRVGAEGAHRPAGHRGHGPSRLPRGGCQFGHASEAFLWRIMIGATDTVAVSPTGRPH